MVLQMSIICENIIKILEGNFGSFIKILTS